MGQVLHGSAKTTHAVRAELQRSKAPAAELARRFGINEKTVRKWRSRPSVEDEPMGPKEKKSTVLSALEEAAIVSLRVQALLPLDDVYVALKDVIPHLSRSSLHRCLQRHGISRLPKVDQRSRNASRPMRSATSTSISPSCAMKAAKLFSSLPSIAPRRSSSPGSIAKPRSSSQLAFSTPSSRWCPTRSTPSEGTMVHGRTERHEGRGNARSHHEPRKAIGPRCADA